MRLLRAAIALAFVLTSLAASATPTSAAGAGDRGFGPASAAGGSAGAGSSASPCSDGKYNFLAPAGSRWRHSLDWSFRSSSVPFGLSTSGVLDVIKRAFGNVTGAHNDCGRADSVSATSRYLGTTSLKPAVTSNGGCGKPDGHNVVGFAPLGGYYAGYTCIWWSNGSIVEADMRLDTDTHWALSPAGCSNALMMEGLVTHEVGHAFGLAHVGEANHGRLTMSVYIDGLCENQEATLGLGDLKGLEALY